MRRRATAAAVAAAAALAGCGTATEDLMAIDVSGGPARTQEHLRVTNDGRGSCGGPCDPSLHATEPSKLRKR